jgi:hypothetical protein
MVESHYECDACGKIVPHDNVATLDTSAGEGTFCKKCRGFAPDCTMCEDGVKVPALIIYAKGKKFCQDCDREVEL